MSRGTGTPALGPREAFALVVETHRRFATALGASIRYGLPTSDEALTRPLNDNWIREIGTALRDSLLASGRSLIEFYSADRTVDRFDSDVLLADFPGISKPAVAPKLEPFKPAIEAHLLHITAWADLGYRRSRPTGNRDWLDWNNDTVPFGRTILEALDQVANQQHPWAQMFARLHTACVVRRDDPTAHWPSELSSPTEIAQLITANGL